MARSLKYKISCFPDMLYPTKDEAFSEAVTQCRSRREPIALMGIGARGMVRRWEVISTNKLYDVNQRYGALVCLVDPPPIVGRIHDAQSTHHSAATNLVELW